MPARHTDLRAGVGQASKEEAAANVVMRGGIIPAGHFAAAVGTFDGKRQIPGVEVVKPLVVAQLLQLIEMPGLGSCVAFARGEPYLDERFATPRSRLIAEKV